MAQLRGGQPRTGVGVRVDEAGSHEQPGGVYFPLSGRAGEVPHRHDPLTLDRHVAQKPWVPRAVEHTPVPDQDVVALLASHERGGAHQEEREGRDGPLGGSGHANHDQSWVRGWTATGRPKWSRAKRPATSSLPFSTSVGVDYEKAR